MPETKVTTAFDGTQASDVQGLTTAEAESRLKQFGLNEIPEKDESTFQRVLKRFWGPIPTMIEVAALLSALAGKWEDFAIIVLLLLVNVLVDFAQEAKALNALKVLKSRLAKMALVRRDGVFKPLEAKYLVPGDCIKIKIGDVVPADVVLSRGSYLQVDQAALTGESLPVTRKISEEVYGNSVVKMGEMEAVVKSTGLQTFFGKSASLVIKATKAQKSHFQKAVMQIGNGLIALTVVLATVLVVVSLFRHDPLPEVLRFVLVLVVASIPVALPAVLSVTMAVGAMNLARKQAIVSRLAAIEELAGVDVLCSDKTGTLTQNKMSIAEPRLYNGHTIEQLIQYSVWASRKENNDPIELPLFEKAADLSLKDAHPDVKKFVPFDPVRKRTEATLIIQGHTLVVAKGAPQVIVQLCTKEENKDRISKDVATMASKGYRSLGVAIKQQGETTFKFAGLIPLYDPPRPDSKSTIEQARHLGLQVKMITGDNQAIAKEIASLLGIGKNILDTKELKSDSVLQGMQVLADVVATALMKKMRPDTNPLEIEQFAKGVAREVASQLETQHLSASHIRKHESEITELVENADGFSQVLPEDKYLIIDTLQKSDHIVAMTGDGVNDAPALKKADAGIAVSGATDAARAAADVVLVAPGLSVIINAIEEARLVFERMKSYATFRISETIRVILFMSLSILIFNFYPVTAIMIILLALLNDLPIMMISYDNASISPVPVRWNMKKVMSVAGVLGMAGLLASFGLFFVLEEYGFSKEVIQSMIFLKLSVAGHSTLFVTRTGEGHFWKRPFPSPKLLIPTFSTQIAASCIAALGVFMAPIGWKFALYIWGYAACWFVVNDYLKVWTLRLMNKERMN